MKTKGKQNNKIKSQLMHSSDLEEVVAGTCRLEQDSGTPGSTQGLNTKSLDKPKDGRHRHFLPMLQIIREGFL